MADVASRHTPWALRHLAVLVLALLAAVPLAGCLGGDAGLDAGKADENLDDRRVVTVVSDPEGDARRYGASFLSGVTDNACGLSEASLRPLCAETVHPALEEGAGQGIGAPAPPTLDLLEVRFTETSLDLIVELDVAELDEDFTDAIDDTRLLDDGDTGWAQYQVCWFAGESEGDWEREG